MVRFELEPRSSVVLFRLPWVAVEKRQYLNLAPSEGCTGAWLQGECSSHWWTCPERRGRPVIAGDAIATMVLDSSREGLDARNSLSRGPSTTKSLFSPWKSYAVLVD